LAGQRQNKSVGIALIIHSMFAIIALLADIFGVIVLKGTGRFEAFQILDMILLGGWFIAIPLSVILVVTSLFSLETILLLVLFIIYVVEITWTGNWGVLSIALAFTYPIVTLMVVIRWMYKKRSIAQNKLV
jgi:hypothetical protein